MHINTFQPWKQSPHVAIRFSQYKPSVFICDRGSGFKVQGSGFKVQGSKFRGSEFRGSKFRVQRYRWFEKLPV
jgi:hypothetical protein